jgi:disulfide oxidoreductase YuzD
MPNLNNEEASTWHREWVVYGGPFCPASVVADSMSHAATEVLRELIDRDQYGQHTFEIRRADGTGPLTKWRVAMDSVDT